MDDVKMNPTDYKPEEVIKELQVFGRQSLASDIRKACTSAADHMQVMLEKIAELEDDSSTLCGIVDRFKVELAAKDARIAELEKDAARYRHLKHQADESLLSEQIYGRICCLGASALDDAIDAAISAKGADHAE